MSSHRALESFRHMSHERPKSIVGIIFVAALVALGIWAWPELQRTIRIHRM